MPQRDNLIVRASLDADMAEVTRIYVHHVLHGLASFETEPPDEAEMRRRRDDVLVKGLPYLVAEHDGVVVGYAYAGIYRPRAAYRDTVENSIYLDAGATGKGIGKRLLSALIAACEARDLRQMIAVVGDSGNLPSIRLHRSCGFRLVGVLQSVGHKHGRWVDSVLLQLALGRGDTAQPSAR